MGPTAPDIRALDHDISPLVEEQLVLELKCWIGGTERLGVFPSSRGRRLPFPLDEDLAYPARQA